MDSTNKQHRIKSPEESDLLPPCLKPGVPLQETQTTDNQNGHSADKVNKTLRFLLERQEDVLSDILGQCQDMLEQARDQLEEIVIFLDGECC